MIWGFVVVFILGFVVWKVNGIDFRKYALYGLHFVVNTLPYLLAFNDGEKAMRYRKRLFTNNYLPSKDCGSYDISTEVIGNCSCRIYTNKQHQNKFLFIYLHGGGYNLGAAGDCDKLMDKFMKSLECQIISIDYPLAPENVFPAAVTETYNTISMIMKKYPNVETLIGGDSAGGSLASIMTQKAAIDGNKWFSHQILIYPAVGSLNFKSNSYSEYKFNKYKSVLSPRFKAELMLTYLGVKVNEENVRHMLQGDSLTPTYPTQSPLNKFINNAYVSPILAPSDVLEKVPPSFIFLATNDILKDEGFEYHTNLKKASPQKSHEFKFMKNLTHGEINFNSNAATDLVANVTEWLKREREWDGCDEEFD
uniref:Abhydrolase_3 domain-containing protein n=1 Tax=Rhabditophanes sp. KR3021 TaxID=114890 RepID=A0AC35TW06_9BILA